jgi:hypothetical protein
MDPEEAKRLIFPLYEKVREQERLKAELEAVKKHLDEQSSQFKDREIRELAESRRARQEAFDRRLREEVPDMDMIAKTRAYQKFLEAPVEPGSSQTNREALLWELNHGNEEYVINKMKRLSSQRPNRADIAQVDSAAPGPRSVPALGSNADAVKQALEQRRSGKIKGGAAGYAAFKQKLMPQARPN